jgi:colanic acid biosynthesis glycosyl transferase WcaI
MRFLILTQYFPPEIGGAQTRLYCLATELRRMGHDVEVVTGIPHYPGSHFFSGYEHRLYQREVREGIVVHRVWLYPATGTGIRRVVNYASFTFTSMLGLVRAGKPDYIFVESPPLFLSFPAWLMGSVWRIPFVFNVADLWPDVAVDAGHIRDGLLVRLMTVMECWSYRRAAYVNAVTEGIRNSLLNEKGVPSAKVLFLPNGADTEHYKPRPPDEGLKAQLGLAGKKIVLWAGTLGPAHGIEHTLRAAEIVKAHGEIHFLFLGHGSERPPLEALSSEMGLSNVTFHDPVSISELPPYYSIAEAGLSSLTKIPIHRASRPSKIFPVLASGKPLIFAGGGETAELIREANAGIVVAPEDPEALADAVLQINQNPALAARMGRNARELVERKFQWAQLIENWINQLRQPGPATPLVSSPTRT